MSNVILPNAFYGIRKNSNKPKICIEFVDSQTLYQKQINNIRKHIPDANITYILGFNADKVDSELTKLGCKVIYNDEYSTTNVAYSISLALQLNKGPNLIIYGDLFFDSEVIEYLPKQPHHSYLVKDTNDSFPRKNIGIGPNKVMDFAFKEKWTQIAYLNEGGSKQFYDTVYQNKNIRKFSHEILNELREKGTYFDVVMCSGYIRELDRIKELNVVNRYICEN